MSHFAAFLCGMMVMVATETAIKAWFRLESISWVALDLAIIFVLVVTWIRSAA